MSVAYTPRPISVQQAAKPTAKPSDCASVTLELTREEARTVAAYLLASSVSAFGMADRAESALMTARADECRSDALRLCSAECKLREAIRNGAAT